MYDYNRYSQRRFEGGARGATAPGAKILGAPKIWNFEIFQIEFELENNLRGWGWS